MIKKVLCIIMTVIMFIMPSQIHAEGERDNRFIDVPEGHWAEASVYQLRDLGITNGITETEFGMGQEISRAEFVTFLVRLKKWQEEIPEDASFTDVSQDDWFYESVERAALNNVIDESISEFRPLDSITREEMALMIVNTLGYTLLAELFNDEPSSFSDVTDNVGTVELLNSFDIVNGKGEGIFAPEETATREQAATILMRMFNKTTTSIESRNAFYADSSYSQMTKIQYFDSVSFGWAKLSYDEETSEMILLDKKPQGYEEPLAYAAENNVATRLSILASDGTKITDANIGIIQALLESDEQQDKIIKAIIAAIAEDIIYDGVVVDFEDISSKDLQEGYSDFLVKLKEALEVRNKSLTVMVQPSLYYQGYDFKTIGEVADQIIIMAHDYNARSLTDEEQNAGYTFTPLAPLQQVYDTLVALTDEKTGVGDRRKISFQISMGTAQWGVNNDKSVNKAFPDYPTYDMLVNRLIKATTEITFNDYIQSPKAEYYNIDNGLDYVIWYEDSRSIEAKINLAKMFDIKQISVWRLGNIPDYMDDEHPVYMDVLNLITESN